jgi:hypothetical protein
MDSKRSVYKGLLLAPALSQLNSVCSTLYIGFFLRLERAGLSTGDVAVFMDLRAATVSSLYGGQSRCKYKRAV